MSVETLEPPVKFWRCPSCSVTERVKQVGAYTRMHSCGGLNGLTAPLVEVAGFDADPDARHLVLEREDYIGQTGMPPVMAVHTDHGDGSNDRTVFAPTATIVIDNPTPAFNRVGGPGGSVSVTPGSAGVEGRNHHKFYSPDLKDLAALAEHFDSTMAFTTSKVFAYAVLQLMSNSVKPSTDSYKVALYGNTGTPDNTVTTAVLTEYAGSASQWVTGNEVSGTGYTAGGVSVSSPTVTQSSNVVTFTSAGSPQWTTASFTAYGCLVYDTTVSNEGLSFNYFGGSQTVTAGTFSISWNASGIATFTA